MTVCNEIKHPLKSQEELENSLREISSKEQVYSIALFDILGFSNFVEANGNKVILELYNKLLDLINKQKSSFDKCESFAGNVAPFPVSDDWKSNVLIADANGYILIIMGILKIGGIFASDFGLFYLVTRNSGPLYGVTSTIDTYVYNGMMSGGQQGMTAAVGFYQSIVGFLLVIGTNAIVRKVSPEDAMF